MTPFKGRQITPMQQTRREFIGAFAGFAIRAGALAGFAVFAGAAAALAGAARLGFAAAAGDLEAVLVGVDFFTVSLATVESPPPVDGRVSALASYGCNVPLFLFGGNQRPACY